jgi:hypothetical protein
MISPGLTDTRVQVLDGRAMVESTALSKNADVRIAQNGSLTKLLKDGVYEFDADRSNVKVFDGKADVYVDDQKVELKKGKTVQVGEGTPLPLKAEKFDRKAAEDALYKWSSARSEYLAKANEASAQAYAVNPRFGFNSGWYWNPWFRTWSFMPYDSMFYSPFGYGFYSPRYYYRPRPVIIVPRTRVIVPRAGITSRGMVRGGMHR